MKCPRCGGKGILHEWIQEPCAYCGGTGELPDGFFEMTKLKRCKKCSGEAVFSGVFDDPPTYRFPECIKCGARAEGNNTKDSWYERAKKWNEQNTPTNENWFCSLPTEEKAKWLADNFGYVAYKGSGGNPKRVQEDLVEYWQEWLKQPHG